MRIEVGWMPLLGPSPIRLPAHPCCIRFLGRFCTFLVALACTVVILSHTFPNHERFVVRVSQQEKAGMLDDSEVPLDGDVQDELVKRQKEDILGKLVPPYDANERSIASGDLLAKMGHLHTVSKQELACRLKSLDLSRTVNPTTPPFTKSHPQAHLFPERKFLNGTKFNTCAVVSNAATLVGSGLGSFIDSHDIVVRMNGAVTSGFEEDVGSKTTARIVNHMVVRYDANGFMDFGINDQAQGTSLLLVESVCETMDRNYTECFVIESEDRIKIKPHTRGPFTFDTLIRYFERRKAHPDEDIHIMDFSLPQKVWQFLQEFSLYPMPRYTPSTGILGLLAMLDICDVVNGFEFIPSVRDATETRCHYWNDVFLEEVAPEDVHSNCTFVQYHPMKTEKLLLLRLNTGSDEQVFQRGFVSLKGLNTYNCEAVK